MLQNKLDTFGQKVAVIDPVDATQARDFANSDGQKKLRALIKRRHPKYKDLVEHWKLVESTYEGGREWFEDNIFRYVKEGDNEFAERKRRAYRFNHSREVVDLLNKYLFRQNISRNEDDAPECVKEFWKKTTRNGLGIADFSRQTSKLSSTFGRIGIVVDNNLPPGSVSIAEAKQNGYSCYAYAVRPQQLLDYSHDDRGDLNWILIEEAYRPDEDPFADDLPVESRWRLWTKNEWILFEEQVIAGTKKTQIVVADSGVHGLGQVPVILHDNIISDEEWASPGMIDDIAYLDRAVANYLSNLDAIIQDQTFSQLVMPAQNLMPGEDSYTKMVEMSTKRVFLYDGEGGLAPSYISPDVKQAQVIVSTIQKIINEIYHTVGLAGERTKEDNSAGVDNSSGVAKAYDFDRVNSLLAAKADSLEATENKINELVAAWNSVEIKKPLVSYPDDFDTRGLYDEFDIAGRLILVEAPEEMRRNQMKSVIQKLFPQISDVDRTKMVAELKSWPPQLDLMEPAAPGKPKPNASKSKADNKQGQGGKTST